MMNPWVQMQPHERETTNIHVFYCGRCMLLIDQEPPNMMLNATASPNGNLFDYIMYIFR